MNSTQAKARADILKALAHPTRVLMLDALSRGDRCVNDLRHPRLDEPAHHLAPSGQTQEGRALSPNGGPGQENHPPPRLPLHAGGGGLHAGRDPVGEEAPRQDHLIGDSDEQRTENPARPAGRLPRALLPADGAAPLPRRDPRGVQARQVVRARARPALPRAGVLHRGRHRRLRQPERRDEVLRPQGARSGFPIPWPRSRARSSRSAPAPSCRSSAASTCAARASARPSPSSIPARPSTCWPSC